MITDPISDFITRIKNACMALQPECVSPHSKMREQIAAILKDGGYIADYKITSEGNKKQITLKLKNTAKRQAIRGLRRVSRPGRRIYVPAKSIPRVLGGLGTAILSTPRGVISGTEAKKLNVGGEVLCYIW
jgi:small subunit ribosomal protein S8